jgi:Fic family protein
MTHIPDKLPLDCLDWTKFIRLIGQANAELARYDGILQGIINPQVLLSPLTTQEAVLSSKIEGTQASLEEVDRRASEDERHEGESDCRPVQPHENRVANHRRNSVYCADTRRPV